MQLNSLALLGLTALHATSSVGSPLAGGGAAQQLVLGHGNTPYVSSVNCSYCPDVGFDLGISYATAVVHYADGSTRFFRAEAAKEYLEMMRRLSDPASKHIHPPYHNIFEKIADQPRQWSRRLSEQALQHASPDVLQIHQLIRSLREEIERGYVSGIEPVVVTRPQILALYDEDIVDALKYNGLLEKEPDLGSVRAAQGCPMPKHLSAVAIGSRVQDISVESKDRVIVLSVLYTRHALQAQQQALPSVYRSQCDWGMSEREDNSILSWELGSDALEFLDQEKYWERVRAFLLELPTREELGATRIDKVILHGESANSTTFLGLVEYTMVHGLPQDEPPDIVCDDPVFVAAKGAMMLAQRERAALSMVG